MTRKTLLKYTDRQLLERLKRLVRMEAYLFPKKEKGNDIDISNTQGIIEDRMMGIKHVPY